MSPTVIDYFKAVFQWSMPQPLGHVDWSSGDLFAAVTISTVWGLAAQERQKMAGERVPGKKMWLEHEVVAQQSLAIGVVSSSAHQAVAAKIQHWLCSKTCSWES